jgi:glutaconate CoA-transferase, subunit B
VSAESSQDELLIGALVRLIGDAKSVATGVASPIPGAAALLAQALSNGATRAMILGGTKYGPFSDGGPELFDRAGQGRIEVFFLGGGQIDGEANINLVGAGPYPAATTRFPGSFGSAYLYYVVPRVILFREEHTRRVLVDKVDFVSAPGWSAEGVYRPGGPWALLTGRCLFRFDRQRHRFRLESLHPGHTLEEVRDNTGFDFDAPDRVPETAPADPAWRALLTGPIREQIAEVYPEFARTRLAPAA